MKQHGSSCYEGADDARTAWRMKSFFKSDRQRFHTASARFLAAASAAAICSSSQAARKTSAIVAHATTPAITGNDLPCLNSKPVTALACKHNVA